MSKYVKIYNEQGIPLGFKDADELSGELGDARVKLYDEKQRLMGFRVGGEQPSFTLEAYQQDPTTELLESFGPYGFGRHAINIPSGAQDYVLRTNVGVKFGDDDVTIFLKWSEEVTGDFLWDFEQNLWYYDGEYINGACELVISHQPPA